MRSGIRFVVAAAVLLAGGIGIYLVVRRVPGSGKQAETAPASRPPAPAQGSPDGDPRRATQPASRPAVERMDLPQLIATLDDFEAVVDRYYRRDPLAEARAAVDAVVGGHVEWLEAQKGLHEVQHGALKRQVAVLRDLAARIETMERRLDERPDRADAKAVATYNALVSRRNGLVRQYNELGKAYKVSEGAFGESLEQFKQEMAVREGKVAAAKGEIDRRVRAYRSWLDSGSRRTFWPELNRLYARLHRETRRPLAAAGLDVHVRRARALRRDVSGHALRRRAGDEDALVIVPATLCGREKGFLVVDTGATTVTISPAMVDVLGLSDRLGERIRVVLAEGSQAAARELVLPRLRVFGAEARDVKAVVLSEPATGIDGLLGLSFLNRFDYRIDRNAKEPLILKPRTLPRGR